MAKKSKCIKCEAGEFELVEYKPINSKSKIILLQCASCGAAIGALDQYNVGLFVSQIAKKLGISPNKI